MQYTYFNIIEQKYIFQTTSQKKKNTKEIPCIYRFCSNIISTTNVIAIAITLDLSYESQ